MKLTDKPPAKVLIVDDDPVTLRLLEGFLQRAGFQMLLAKEGRAAVALAQNELPQVIVMDVMMPQVGGLDALRQIKRGETTKDIPVIIIAASDHPLVQKESQQSGAAAFLTKPFSPAKLLAEVKRILTN
jgi:CheY-like chemotaxis protein